MTRYKIKLTPILLALLVSLCSGCRSENNSDISDNTTTIATAVPPQTTTTADDAATGSTTSVSSETTTFEVLAEPVDTSELTYDGSISLNGDSISYKGNGLTKDNTTLTITKGGTYYITGTLNNGQLIVNASDDKKVTLVMDNASITNDAACIEVINTKKLIIILEDNSNNSLTCTGNLSDENVDANAALYSKEDLTFKGTGTLSVSSTHNGITSKDELKIKGGTFIINAKNNGIKGKDCVEVTDADINITAGNDGIKSDNTDVSEDKPAGYVTVTSGNINIISDGDGIQAEGTLTIDNGTFNITAGGGSANASKKSESFWGFRGNSSASYSSDTVSCKAIKASGEIVINGGMITIDSADDAVHSNTNLTINNGRFTISTGDDGMHADTNLTINDGYISINKSYEGIEASDITVNGGTIYVTSSDDGFNAAGGTDNSQSGGMFGGDRFNPMSSSSNNSLTFNGGYIYVNAQGDGLDSNGNIYMTGGTVIVNGPTDSGNGSLDFDKNFNMTGGTLIAAGSSGMLQTPDSTSTVNTVSIVFTGTQKANSVIQITDEDGKEIITYSSPKTTQAFLFSSNLLEKGKTYKIYTNGTYTGGTETDGVYTGGTYTGTEYDSFTVSGSVTSVGRGNGFGGGGFGGGGFGGGGFGGGGGMRPR